MGVVRSDSAYRISEADSSQDNRSSRNKPTDLVESSHHQRKGLGLVMASFGSENQEEVLLPFYSNKHARYVLG